MKQEAKEQWENIKFPKIFDISNPLISLDASNETYKLFGSRCH